MKKRIISLFTALLALITILVITLSVIFSCNDNLPNMKLSGEVPPAQKEFTKAEKLTLPDGVNFYTRGAGHIMITINDYVDWADHRYGLFNIKTKEGTKTEYNNCYPVSWGYAKASKAMEKKENGEDIYKFGIINCKGDIIVPFEYEYSELSLNSFSDENYLKIKDEMYEIGSNGSLKPYVPYKIKDLNLDNLHKSHKSGRYIFGSTYLNKKIYVFNLSGQLIKAFENISGFEYFQKVFLLGGDNVLTQSFTMLPLDYTGEDYDVFISGYKWRMKTELYNLKTRKTKTVDFNYAVKDCQSENSDPGSWTVYNKSMGINSILRLEKIVDKVFREISEDTFTAIANKNIKLTAMLPRNADKVEKIDENRFFVSGGYESDFIMDKKCNIIEQLGTKNRLTHVSKGLAVMYKMNSDYSYSYGIIDKNGSILIPFEFNSITNFYGDYAIGRKGSDSREVYRINRQGNIEFIADSDIQSTINGYYYIYDSENHIYTLYNYAGTKLLDSYSGFYDHIVSDNLLFVRESNQNNNYEYYIIT